MVVVAIARLLTGLLSLIFARSTGRQKTPAPLQCPPTTEGVPCDRQGGHRAFLLYATVQDAL